MGMWEILLIFLVVLLLFGAKRLPEIGSSLGKGIREFKGSLREIENELKVPEDRKEPSRQVHSPRASEEAPGRADDSRRLRGEDRPEVETPRREAPAEPRSGEADRG